MVARANARKLSVPSPSRQGRGGQAVCIGLLACRAASPSSVGDGLNLTFNVVMCGCFWCYGKLFHPSLRDGCGGNVAISARQPTRQHLIDWSARLMPTRQGVTKCKCFVDNINNL